MSKNKKCILTVFMILGMGLFCVPTTSVFATNNSPTQTEGGGTKQDCSLATTACSSKCNGNYGMFCMWGTSCNGATHRCEKNEAIFHRNTGGMGTATQTGRGFIPR